MQGEALNNARAAEAILAAARVKPRITSIMDDEGFEAYADMQLSKYVDPDGTPKGFIPTTPELDALYADAERRGIELVDVRKESYRNVLPDGRVVQAETRDMPADSPAAARTFLEAAGLVGRGEITPAGKQSSGVKRSLDDIKASNGHTSLGNLVDGPLYRETSIDEAINMLPTGETITDLSLDRPFFANKPEYAIGQGNNKGVLLEFEPTGLSGVVSKAKPAWEAAYTAGYVELEGRSNHQSAYQKALSAITIKPEATSDRVAKSRLQHAMQALKAAGWVEEQLPGGGVRLSKPSTDVTPVGKQNTLRTEFTKTGGSSVEGDIPGISSTGDVRDPREITWENNIVESIPDFNAVGKVLAEDVVNPMELDISGRPKLVFPAGTKLNEEAVAQIANLGYETVRTVPAVAPRTAPSPPTSSPEPLPTPTAPESAKSPSALPAVAKLSNKALSKLDDKLIAELDKMSPNDPGYAAKVEELKEVTAESNRREQAKADKIPVFKRAPNFDTEGTYNLTVDGETRQVFRDPEKGMWYWIDPNSPDTYLDPKIKFAGSNKADVVKNMKADIARVKPSADLSVVGRPYADLEGAALLDLRDNLQTSVDGFGSKVPKEIQAELEAVNAEINGRKIGTFRGPDAVDPPPVDASKLRPIEQINEPNVNEPPPLDPAKFRQAPSRLSDSDLDAQIDRLSYDIGDGITVQGRRTISVGDPDKIRLYQKRLSDLITEKTKRSAPPPTGPGGMPPVGGSGIKLQSHPAIGAFLGGYTYGYLSADDDLTQQERLDRAFMWGLGSGGLVWGAKYIGDRQAALRKPKVSNLLPGRNQVGIEKVVYSMDDLKKPRGPFLTQMRDWYTGASAKVHYAYSQIAQSTEGLETFVEKIGRKELPSEMNPFKLASMFGTWIARTEAFLTGRRPLTYVVDGEPVPITNETFLAHGLSVDPETGAAPLTLARILELAEGDKAALGDLAVAYASMEGAGRGPVPMNIATREALIRSASPKLRLAVKELRKYNLALAFVLHKSGRLSLDGLQKMAAEDWYTPFHRIVEAVDRINASRPGRSKIATPDPIKGRRGGSRKQVLNPYEVSIDMTRRMLRASEYGQLVESLLYNVELLPLSAQRDILRPVTNSANPKTRNLDKILTSDEMKSFQQTSRLSESDAKSLLAYIDDDTVLGQSGILTAYRNGQLQSYVIERPDIFEAMKSLMPTEINWLAKLLGAPTRVAARGTVLNPIFALNQAFMDNFTVTLNSKYGFRPGWDNFRGWWHAMIESPQYQQLIDVGGSGSIAQLDYTNPETALQASRTKGANVVDTAVRNIKEMSVARAYKAFLYPILEAPRVGEYLRALDHGTSTLEAAYAAHEVSGNLRMQGALGVVRGFHQMTLFSRPAMAGILKTVKEAGLGLHAPEYNKTPAGRLMQRAGVPRRAAGAFNFMVKGVATIAIPSLALWAYNQGDEEISQLRRTVGGQRYWFIRLPNGEIAKFRKPHVIGQVFGTTVENWADAQHQADPEAFARWMEGLTNDVSVNMLPQIGVVPYSLWAGKSLGLNAPLTPMRDADLSPELQGFDKASLPARVIADKLAPISGSGALAGDDILATSLRRGMSPAGVDYVIGQLTGMLGQDAVRAVGAAMEYNQSGFLPPKEELPLIGRLVQAYPTMNVREVQAFYRRDDKVRNVSADLKWVTENKPELIADFLEENMPYVRMATVHQQTRQDVANLRRAIDDLKRMPAGYASRKYRKSLEQSFIKLIEERMRVANTVSESMLPQD